MMSSNFSSLRKIAAVIAIALVLLFSLSTNVYAASASGRSSSSIKPIPNVPDAYCLDVSATAVYNQNTVASTTPPGAKLTYNSALYVSNNCDGYVSPVRVSAYFDVLCPHDISPMHYQTNWDGPYGLYKGGGYGSPEYNGSDSCLDLTNGVPTRSYVPTTVTMSIYASAPYDDGAPGQTALAPEKVIQVWP